MTNDFTILGELAEKITQQMEDACDLFKLCKQDLLDQNAPAAAGFIFLFTPHGKTIARSFGDPGILRHYQAEHTLGNMSFTSNYGSFEPESTEADAIVESLIKEQSNEPD